MNALTVTEPLSLVLGRMNEIQEAERATIALMPGMSGDELLHVLAYAKTMGAASWRIECAAHWEIVARKPKHGEKAGLIAAAAGLAGCATGTIYRNADIHGLAEMAPDIEEKAIFVEVLALPRDDWADTVTMLAGKLHSRENYGIRDVKADIHARRGGEPEQKTETISNVSLRLSQDTVRQLTAVCSTKRITPSEWVTRCLWVVNQPEPISTFCVGVSEEQLAWLAQKAAKRAETYGADDEKGTPEGYLEFILAYRMREDERNAKRNR